MIRSGSQRLTPTLLVGFALLPLGLALLPHAGFAEDARAYPSAEATRPLQPGARVPSATVRNLAGEAVDVAGLVREQGALLVFYRGGW